MFNYEIHVHLFFFNFKEFSIPSTKLGCDCLCFSILIPPDSVPNRVVALLIEFKWNEIILIYSNSKTPQTQYQEGVRHSPDYFFFKNPQMIKLTI